MRSTTFVILFILSATGVFSYPRNNEDVRSFVEEKFRDEVEFLQEVKAGEQVKFNNNVKVTEEGQIEEAVNDDKEVSIDSEVMATEEVEFIDKVKFAENKNPRLVKAVNEVKVTVDTSQVVSVVEDYFLSFNIDSYIFQPDVHWLKMNFSSPKIYTLLAALSPALLRVGGSPADWLFFNKPFDVIDRLKLRPTAVVMTKSDLVNLVGLTRTTGNRLLFDFNLQLRFGSQWDPSNAIELLEFCSQMGFGDNMDWELGNEPEYNTAKGQITLTPEQIGKDFRLLRSLLSSYTNMANSRIVGPDIVGTTPRSYGLKIIQGVANATGDFLRAITFHHYYFRGDVATYKDYIDPKYFADLAQCIGNVRDTVRRSKYPSLPLWIGETSDAWHSGTENVSDRFVSGFLWMDKLGVAAQLGVGVVMRQTLYGYYYSLLDIDMNPNPDYWLSWLHRLLVGRQVFSVELAETSVNGSAPTTRIYAHCTNYRRSARYKQGALTVFGLNVQTNSSVSLEFTGILSNQPVDAYLLEPSGPDGLLSRWVNLNGKRLQMLGDTQMPEAIPVKLPSGGKVVLPPLTFGFYVFPEANLAICQ